jgi:hypothetical protein
MSVMMKVEVPSEEHGKPSAWARVKWGNKKDFVAVIDEGDRSGKVVIPKDDHAFQPPERPPGMDYYVIARLIKEHDTYCVGHIAAIREGGDVSVSLGAAGYVASNLAVAKAQHVRWCATLLERCHQEEKRRQFKLRTKEVQQRLERNAAASHGEMAARLYDQLLKHDFMYDYAESVEAYTNGVLSEDNLKGTIGRIGNTDVAEKVWKLAASKHIDVFWQLVNAIEAEKVTE